MKKSEKTRLYIIEKSSPLFNKFGYSGTSMSQIINEIGLTKGAIYGNFSCKEEIAAEALRFNYMKISAMVVETASSCKNCCDKLVAAAEFFENEYEFIDANGGCPLLNAAVDNDDGNPVLKMLVNELLDDWERYIVAILKKGISKKEIKAEVDMKRFTVLFIELIEGGIMLSKITGDKKYIKTAVDQIISTINSDLRY